MYLLNNEGAPTVGARYIVPLPRNIEKRLGRYPEDRLRCVELYRRHGGVAGPE